MGVDRRLAAVALWIASTGCEHHTPVERPDRSALHLVPSAYAEHFERWEGDGNTLLLVFGHGGKQDTVGRYRIGAAHAAAGNSEGAIPEDLRKLALSSTTHVPFLVALGAADRISACAHVGDVRDEAIKQRLARGEVKEIAQGDGLDREALVALAPQVLFTYPFGMRDPGVPSQAVTQVVQVAEYLEEHPLGRAEWLLFFGALLGKEHEADSLFTGIRERYERMRDRSDMVERPTVLFGSVWDGQWWVPPGNSYMARLIEDAGGSYRFADHRADGNIPIDMETMVTTASDADLWGMIAHIPGDPVARDFTGGDARSAGFKAVREHRLFIGNTRTADLFGRALIEPDRLLDDLRRIFRTERGDEAVGTYFSTVPLIKR
ncbi:MAG: ABC transporter substrate-binding protein [Flavobacteriales bacterium]|nr:ABC transporter substrate-binding protein [Flavobacteriales bacterium]